MTDNAAHAAWLVDALVRAGVGSFFLAPGSRSTPLTLAVARHPGAAHVMHFDERGSAFLALGCARGSGAPAAWVTTSGSAVANGMPAVVEAAMDGVPLVLLTADRPPELRDSGANQTIHQAGIFGRYAVWSADLPAPDAAFGEQHVRSAAAHAVHRALEAPGPVHLNCMFREPLAPAAGVELPAPWNVDARSPAYAVPRRLPSDAVVAELAEAVGRAERGVVVAGRLHTPDEGAAAARLSAHLGWPLLADPLAQVPAGADALQANHDLILADRAFADAHAPTAVLSLGRTPVSKRLGLWLDAVAPPTWAVVHASADRIDPHARITHRVQADVGAFVDALTTAVPARAPGAWTRAWTCAGERAERVAAQILEAAGEALTEPGVLRAVARQRRAGHGLWLASSMPIRDADAFGGPLGARVAANRGASGIDGLVASAVGYGLGLEAPVTLVVGDLALLHDLNSLALARGRRVVVVVINNDGGGIFHFLPIASRTDVFEPLVGTPHGMTFEHAAAQFGLEYAAPSTMTALKDAYATAAERAGPTLIEVRTDRTRNAELHRRIVDAIVDAGRDAS